jgi:S1-C subfamily serine protease
MTESASFARVQDLSAALAQLVGSAAPSIVAVRSDHSRSSGFFWRPELIVTADEALSEEGDIAVTLPGGDTIAARLVGRDHTTDIALLRVDRSDVTPLQLESLPVAVGALAIAVGAEDGAPHTSGLSLCAASLRPSLVPVRTVPSREKYKVRECCT